MVLMSHSQLYDMFQYSEDGAFSRAEDSRASEGQTESWEFKSTLEAPIARLESLDELESSQVGLGALKKLYTQRATCTKLDGQIKKLFSHGIASLKILLMIMLLMSSFRLILGYRQLLGYLIIQPLLARYGNSVT